MEEGVKKERAKKSHRAARPMPRKEGNVDGLASLESFPRSAVLSKICNAREIATAYPCGYLPAVVRPYERERDREILE